MIALVHGEITLEQARAWVDGCQPDWATEHPKMLACPDPTIRALAEQHDRLIETRTDWTRCAITARRRLLLAQWRIYNERAVSWPE